MCNSIHFVLSELTISCLKGYEISENEIKITLDEFKRNYVRDDGLVQYVIALFSQGNPRN